MSASSASGARSARTKVATLVSSAWSGGRARDASSLSWSDAARRAAGRNSGTAARRGEAVPRRRGSGARSPPQRPDGASPLSLLPRRYGAACSWMMRASSSCAGMVARGRWFWRVEATSQSPDSRPSDCMTWRLRLPPLTSTCPRAQFGRWDSPSQARSARGPANSGLDELRGLLAAAMIGVMDKAALSQRFLGALTARKGSHWQLARAVGVHPSTLSSWLHGSVIPKPWDSRSLLLSSGTKP